MMCLASRQGRGEFQRITRKVLVLKVLTSSRHAAEQAAHWRVRRDFCVEEKSTLSRRLCPPLVSIEQLDLIFSPSSRFEETWRVPVLPTLID